MDEEESEHREELENNLAALIALREGVGDETNRRLRLFDLTSDEIAALEQKLQNVSSNRSLRIGDARAVTSAELLRTSLRKRIDAKRRDLESISAEVDRARERYQLLQLDVEEISALIQELATRELTI